MREEVMKAFQRVCEHYNYRTCKHAEHCKKLHVCKWFARYGYCTSKTCRKAHQITPQVVQLLRASHVQLSDSTVGEKDQRRCRDLFANVLAADDFDAYIRSKQIHRCECPAESPNMGVAGTAGRQEMLEVALPSGGDVGSEGSSVSGLVGAYGRAKIDSDKKLGVVERSRTFNKEGSETEKSDEIGSTDDHQSIRGSLEIRSSIGTFLAPQEHVDWVLEPPMDALTLGDAAVQGSDSQRSSRTSCETHLAEEMPRSTHSFGVGQGTSLPMREYSAHMSCIESTRALTTARDMGRAAPSQTASRSIVKQHTLEYLVTYLIEHGGSAPWEDFCAEMQLDPHWDPLKWLNVTAKGDPKRFLATERGIWFIKFAYYSGEVGAGPPDAVCPFRHFLKCYNAYLLLGSTIPGKI